MKGITPTICLTPSICIAPSTYITPSTCILDPQELQNCTAPSIKNQKANGNESIQTIATENLSHHSSSTSSSLSAEVSWHSSEASQKTLQSLWDWRNDQFASVTSSDNTSSESGNSSSTYTSSSEDNSSIESDFINFDIFDVEFDKKLDEKFNLELEIEKAFEGREDIQDAVNTDEFLNLLGEKAIAEDNISLVELIIERMNTVTYKGPLQIYLVKKALAKEGKVEDNIEDAFKIVNQMLYAITADEARVLIRAKALETGNILLAKRAVKKMTNAELRASMVISHP